jgi:hypothetical protein
MVLPPDQILTIGIIYSRLAEPAIYSKAFTASKRGEKK